MCSVEEYGASRITRGTFWGRGSGLQFFRSQHWISGALFRVGAPDYQFFCIVSIGFLGHRLGWGLRTTSFQVVSIGFLGHHLGWEGSSDVFKFEIQIVNSQ